MKPTLTLLLAFLPVTGDGADSAGGSAPRNAAEKTLTLARDGRTDYVIVEAAAPLPNERLAARELAGYLKRVTGAEFKIVAEAAEVNEKLA